MIVTNQLSEEQIRQLHRLYKKEWWTKDRTLEETRKVVKGSSLVFGICEMPSNRLVGFARVLTDWVFKALIFDVIVDESYQNTGLGRQLMDNIVAHTDLKQVKHFELYCLPEKQVFYQKWGFSNDVANCSLMRMISSSPPSSTGLVHFENTP
jgi:N-acetylglutamate synthase-like GNAT family acetyltransferase